MEFKKLFEPIMLGKLEIKNRIGASCTTTGGADIKGYLTEQCYAAYALRSRGGAGFVTIECTFATDAGAESTSFGNPRISNRSYYQGLNEIVDTMHSMGTKAFIQITPGFGRQGSGKLSGKTPGAPSAIPSERPKDWEDRIMPRGYETRSSQFGDTSVPRVLTIEEIKSMEETFADAVAAARIVGFDAVEFHSPHGYLIHQFLSPRSNQRNDLYGGSFDNRIRFLKNLMINARRRVGKDYPLGIRLSGDEHMPGGIHEDELIKVAIEMQNYGADYCHMSDGSYEARKQFFPQDPNCMISHAINFKKALKIPVICPSVHDPYLAEQLIAEGKIDMISLGRQLIADPYWPQKVQEGKVDEVKRCLRCNVCLSRFNRGLSVRCVLNPDIGRERYLPELERPQMPSRTPPCEAACPAGLEINNYILMASRGYFADAMRYIRAKVPLPGVIGRVCPHPCENECNRGKIDEPIAINAIKRFSADWVAKNGGEELTYIEPAKITRSEQVAVVGSGPAGLTAAYDLVRLGFPVTVFEAAAEAGGMMRYGIPDHRLPKDIVKNEIAVLKKVGVQIKTNSNVTDIEGLKKEGYKAILLAVGAQVSSALDCEGTDLNGVYDGLSLLKDINTGKKVKVGNKVVVIGGGNVAVDCARTALRLGAGDVTLVYRRTREEMPAIAAEVKEAEEEGVKILDTWGPKTITGKSGKVTGVEFQKYLGKAGNGKKSAPAFDAKNTRTVDADTVILAIGQTTDLSFLTKKNGVKAKDGLVIANAATLVTDDSSVYAAGDVVTGPATVIEAIAAGHKAAAAMATFLGAQVPAPTPTGPLANLNEPTFQFHLREVTKESRVAVSALPSRERAGSFKEVNQGFADKAACVKEARRCITCRCSSMAY